MPDMLVMSLLAPEAAAPKLVRAPPAVVAPVPPLATASVPASVIVPEPVIGPPEVVRPVVPPDTSTEVTVPTPPAEIHSTSVAPVLTASTLPLLPV